MAQAFDETDKYNNALENIASKNYKDARKQFKELAKMGEKKNRETYYVFISFCDMKLGQLKAAQKRLTYLVKKSKDPKIKEKASALLKKTNEEFGRWQVLRSGIGDPEEKSESEFEKLMDEAMYYYNQNDFDSALPIFQFIAEKYGFEPAMFLAGSIYHIIRDYKSAAKYFARIKHPKLKQDIEKLEKKYPRERKYIGYRDYSEIVRKEEVSEDKGTLKSFGLSLGYDGNPLGVSKSVYDNLAKEQQAQMFYVIDGLFFWLASDTEKRSFFPFLTISYTDYFIYDSKQTLSFVGGLVTTFKLAKTFNWIITPNISYQMLNDKSLMIVYGASTKLKYSSGSWVTALTLGYAQQKGLREEFESLNGNNLKIGLEGEVKSSSTLSINYGINQTSKKREISNSGGGELELYVGAGYDSGSGVTYDFSASYSMENFDADSDLKENQILIDLTYANKFNRNWTFKLPLEFLISEKLNDGAKIDGDSYNQLKVESKIIYNF